MAVTATQPRETGAHAPSAPPDPKAWFSRLAAFSARRRRFVIGFWLVVTLAAAPLAITLNGALSGAGWEAQGSNRSATSSAATSPPSAPRTPS